MKNLILTLTLLISFVFFGQDNKVTFKDGSTFDVVPILNLVLILLVLNEV